MATRVEKMQRAVELRARGLSYSKIGKDIGVSRQTAATMVNDAYAITAERRSHDKEKAISVYEEIIKEAWERLKTVDNRSLNSAGFLNSIRAAQERIDKLTGAEAPIKSDVNLNDRRQRVQDAIEELIADEPLGGAE